MRVAPLLLLSLVCSVAVPASAAEKVLTPSTDWQFSITEETHAGNKVPRKECRVARQFGQDRDTVVLQFTGLIGPFFYLELAGHPLGDLKNERFTTQFGPHEESYERGAHFAKSDRGEPMFLMAGMTLAPADPEDALDGRQRFADIGAKRQAAVEWLRLSSGTESIKLMTGELFGAFAALDSCLDAIRRNGEPMPVFPRGKLRPPVPASFPGDWMVGSDVPKFMGPQPIDGVATVKLAVDNEGRVTGCEVQDTTNGFRTLGTETCRIFSERAIFFPALNESGEPVEGSYTQSVKVR
jgi:hypothetical protein